MAFILAIMMVVAMAVDSVVIITLTMAIAMPSAVDVAMAFGKATKDCQDRNVCPKSHPLILLRFNFSIQ